MQRHYIGPFQQRLQRRQRLGITQRQLGFNIVEQHSHPQRLSQYPDLGADMPIADNTQALAPRLVRTGGSLHPTATMSGGIALRDAAQQQDNLGQRQLGHAAGIGKWRIEHRNATPLGHGQIDLIGANAKAANPNQPRSVLQH